MNVDNGNNKIKMKVPLVEMDGDEMARVIWAKVKKTLIEPYIDLKTDYYDLGLKHRDETEDRVTVEAANAAKNLGVAVKCATITANAQRLEEYNLKQMWRSPNGTIRSILDGTVFRTPIVINSIKPSVRIWKKPITIARHAYGDIYKASEIRVNCPGRVELIYTPEGGEPRRELVHDFKTPGVALGFHNLDNSISTFARTCLNYAIFTKQDVWFSSKDTILKQYDGLFKDVIGSIFESEYKSKFDELKIKYFYTLIDDAIARIMRSEGGFIWACKNYDGDVMSDMVATAFGSLAMMTSVLVSPNNCFEYEAAHGTVTRHYYKHLNGEETSTNPLATIFAWTGALRKRGELDGAPELGDFATRLENASSRTIEDGVMTKDIFEFAEIQNKRVVNTEEFLKEIAAKL